MKEFGKILKELRVKENLSQEALGNIVHVSRSAIAKYENGLGLPSKEVVDELCKYFKVDNDYLFPKENVEQLITEKNIIINKQKIMHLLITFLLLLIIFILISFLIIFNVDHKEDIILDDIETAINYNDDILYQKTDLLLKYKGGYVYQTIDIDNYAFTDITNLYIIRVKNDYTNGYMGHLNESTDLKEFDENEYTESVSMRINFSISQNYNIITSWHQKKPYTIMINSQLNPNSEVKLDDNINLWEDAQIKKNSDYYAFNYNGRITDLLFDYEYNELIRKCTIINNQWNSIWKYEMIDKESKIATFTIESCYLIEAKPKELISFDIITKMNNTHMSIEQNKKVSLYL